MFLFFFFCSFVLFACLDNTRSRATAPQPTPRTSCCFLDFVRRPRRPGRRLRVPGFLSCTVSCPQCRRCVSAPYGQLLRGRRCRHGPRHASWSPTTTNRGSRGFALHRTGFGNIHLYLRRRVLGGGFGEHGLIGATRAKPPRATMDVLTGQATKYH